MGEPVDTEHLRVKAVDGRLPAWVKIVREDDQAVLIGLDGQIDSTRRIMRYRHLAGLRRPAAVDALRRKLPFDNRPIDEIVTW